MCDYIAIVMANVKLKEGPGALRRLLFQLYLRYPLSTKELARLSLLPVPVVTAIKKEFIKLGIFEQKNGVNITSLGLEYLEQILGYEGLDRATALRLLEEEDYCCETAEDMASRIQDIYDARPVVDVTIDQAKGTSLTAIKRAVLCFTQYSLVGCRVLCVGDDDLVSVALGFLLRRLFPDQEQLPAEVYVFEKDQRYLSYIQDIAQKNSLPITCEEIDLTEPLPLDLTNSFDCFFTDPPYTLEGMSLFLSRGISALKKTKGQKIFLSFGQKPVEDTYRLQEVLWKHGVVLTEIHPSFNRYEGASLLGNVGQMMVLDTTDHLRAVIPSQMEYETSIYTGDRRILDAVYICKTCKISIPLGRGRTIEQLKQDGCPSCGATTFDKKHRRPVTEPGNIPQKRSLGQHILADFFGCAKQLLSDADAIRDHMHTAAEKANASIVSEEFHTFSPWGVSGAIIIQESHLTIHTWPEYQYAAVDLFTCGDSLKLQDALLYLKQALQCEGMDTTDVSRGVFRLGGIDRSEFDRKGMSKHDYERGC